MRITFVTMQFGRSYAQGTERYVGSLGECLSGRGHQVSYLTGDPLGLDRPGSLGEPADPARKILAYPTRGGWLAVMGLSPARVAAWLRGHRPDLVHVANPAHVGVGVMAACQGMGIPVVVTAMDFWWVCPKSTLLRSGGEVCDGTPGWRECVRCLAADHPRAWVRPLGRLPLILSPLTAGLYFLRAAARGMSPADMYRWTRRRSVLSKYLDAADEVIFPSSATCEAIRGGITHGRWRIIPYGLPAKWFENPRPRAARVSAAESLTIGYAGAILPHKGPHLLLAAARRLEWNRCRIRLAGKCTHAAYWEKMQAASQNLNVEFVGQLPGDEMPAFLRSLDVLAVTSLWPENLPFVVLEAQAAGVPVVASDVAGVTEQIPNQRMRFEPGSVAALASALQYVREHPGSCQPGELHTIEEMTDATEEVYRAARTRHGRE